MIVIDIETTGLNQERNSAISIGAVEFENPRNFFYAEFKPWVGAEVDVKALEINGLNIQSLTLSHKDGIKKFDDWFKSIREKTIAGQNVGQFDLYFLKKSYEKANLEWPLASFPVRVVDLHSVAYSKYIELKIEIPKSDNGQSLLTTDTILGFVGLPPEPRPHNALTGAKMEAEALSRLLYGRNLFIEYEKYLIPDYLKLNKK